MANVTCGECGSPLDDPVDGPPNERVSCPRCGSTVRKFAKATDGALSFREKVRLRKFEEGRGRKFAEELTQGDDLHRDSGRWNRLMRHIDRVRDRYRERVVDGETGNVIREVDEPLSKHQGRGDAKRKRKPS